MRRGKSEYIERATRGEGFMPWQSQDATSPEEDAFRARMEARKDDLLARRHPVRHPVLLNDAQRARARENIEATRWGREGFDRMRDVADHIIGQPEGYIEAMIPAWTPSNPYGFTCPNCVGVQSIEGAGVRITSWDYRHPDILACRICGQTYPDERFPETGQLVAPRRGQTFTYYLNNAQRAHPDDRSGDLAWKWVGYPIQVSFSGMIRGNKIHFMADAALTLGRVFQMTGDPRYARTAMAILDRFAHCMPNWLYHDYWDTFADCDPLYAAWHDRALKLEWKRHPSTSAYKRDEPECAAMLQTFWGAGRIHPSADTTILNPLVPAYDLVADARDARGEALWSDEARVRVMRDLILEQLFTGEPFLGGPGKADNASNKSPYVYRPMALVGRVLGIAEFAHVAMSGYERLRDVSFLPDGFSHESPNYTMMFLRGIIHVPEILDGVVWPDGFAGRTGTVQVFRDDPLMRRIMRTAVESLAPTGHLLPLSDTRVDTAPEREVFEIGLRHYPEWFRGAMPSVYRASAQARYPRVAFAEEPSDDLNPTAYAVFNLRQEDLVIDRLDLPETLFPTWQTAILRHGRGPDAAAAVLAFDPPGGHRHLDSLGLYYTANGRDILAEQGYVGDSVMRRWGGATLSHNLVVVDDEHQIAERETRLRMMAASPRVSMVEAQSRAYSRCRAYRRLIALLKGPGNRSLLLDLFRVDGGDKHAYRLFSNIAASDTPGGAMRLIGLELELPDALPDFGGSVSPEHVYGLRDVRRADHPSASWQALWRDDDGGYRLHVLTGVRAVEISHGPGQQTDLQTGRRVRYLDLINEGSDIASTFVTVHEPTAADGESAVIESRRLTVPPEAGPDAVAVRLRTTWGDYRVFSDFEHMAELEGIRFQGRFGVWGTTPEGGHWLFACGASTLERDGAGFTDATPEWSGRVEMRDDVSITVDSPCPDDGFDPPAPAQAWVLAGDDKVMTGYPIERTDASRIIIRDFPLQPATRARLPALRYLAVESLGPGVMGRYAGSGAGISQ